MAHENLHERKTTENQRKSRTEIKKKRRDETETTEVEIAFIEQEFGYIYKERYRNDNWW